MQNTEISKFLVPGARAHLVGIGGVSMAPLAEVLKTNGMVISGSDMSEGESVQHLRSLGIQVYGGHFPENVNGADCIIRTAAVHDDNPEIAAAFAANIPVFSRAEAWGELMKHYKNALCISGTHGKTTTTSMCTHILMAAQTDPTVMIGGTLPLLGAGYRIGEGDTVLFESCEYCNSFLSFFPTIAVILDIEADHLDFFKDLQDVEKSFRAFAELVPDETGYVVANCEDPNTMDTLSGCKKHIVTYGVETGDVHAANLAWVNGLASFDAIYLGSVFAHIELSVPGIHNVKNALAAVTSAILLGIPASAVEAGLNEFHGAGRRFEYKGECNGAKVYDDYAHHPGELDALFTAVAPLGYKRIICAFQPHTYSRTKALFDDFILQLKRPDITVLMDIYAARETDTLGVSSQMMCDLIPNSICCNTLDDVAETLKKIAQPGDLILTVGAGQLNKVADMISK